MAETKQKIVGGRGIEFQHFANRVVQGFMLMAPTNGSTQATGTGASDYNVNITAGILAVGSTVKEMTVQADYDLEHASTGSGILTLNQARVYDYVAYRSPGDGVVYLKMFKGTIADTLAAAVPVTDTEIEATMATGTYWMRIGRTTIERDGDTSISQTYDNTLRNTMIPGTVHYGTNPLA